MCKKLVYLITFVLVLCLVLTGTVSAVDEVADGETPVAGTITGSYVDTQASDDVYESITEKASTTGAPSNRYSYLEHKWTINVTGGDTVTFYVEAYHTTNTEGDEFVFAYSTDDSAYTDMLTVTKTSDDNTYQSYELPSSTSGTVYIRVKDADQTGGNTTLDTIYVDHMYIQSVGSAPPVVDPSILGWWKLDEASGTTAADSSNYGNTGILYGSPVWQPTGGKIDGALEFDGIDDYVQTADDLDKLQITGDYTLAVWTNANSAQSDWVGIMVKTSPDGSINHWGLQFNDVGGIVVYHPDGSWDTGITLSNIAGKWHHIGIVRSASTITSYLDGKEVNSNTWLAAPGSGDGHLNIGTERSASCNFAGLIDDTRVYDRALSSTEMSDLFRVDLAIAWDPKPIDEAALVSSTTYLSWSAGDYAVSHNVYFGTDPTPDETEFQGNQTATTFDPGVLQNTTTYYWRIDEVDDTNPNSPWVGNVWSFTTSGEDVITFFILADTHYGYQSADDEAANKATIDNMNALPGTTYPDDFGGGAVQTPAGVLIAGDLTQWGDQAEWDGWVSLYGINGEGRVNYPAYEGYGNHDTTIYGEEVPKNEIINRNLNRIGLTNISSNGWHYSWDWGVDPDHQVHFINLNLYPGGNTEAEDSLTFLEDDLATYVGSSGRPVIIEQHYGFDDFSNDYWSAQEQRAYSRALSGYNVIGIFHGHHHSTFFYTWDIYDIYNVSHAPREKFIVVRITQSEMVVLEREGTDTWGIKTWKPISW